MNNYFNQLSNSFPDNPNPVLSEVVFGVRYSIQQCTNNDIDEISGIVLVKGYDDTWLVCKVHHVLNETVIIKNVWDGSKWLECNIFAQPKECFKAFSYTLLSSDAVLLEYESKSEGVLERLAILNPIRCKAAFGFDVDEWSEAQWATALSGEVGELCNFVKKEFRDNVDHKEDIKKEAADVVIYLDFICQKYGFSLADAVVEKFNEVSKKKGVDIFL